MNRRIAMLVLAPALVASLWATAAPTTEERRKEARDIAENTLARLYKSQPAARDAVDRSAGYAVFSNFGMKILLAGGGKGLGIAVNRKTKAETFMKMVEVQAGLGMGVKKFRLIWIFEKQSDLDAFINNGWEIGSQATASAQLSGQGKELYAGAMSIKPGVWLYQLTDDGLAAELTAKGTKYYKDSELN